MFFPSVQTGSGAQPTPCSVGVRGFFFAGPEADHSHTASDKIKNVWHSIFIACMAFTGIIYLYLILSSTTFLCPVDVRGR
jgi:hypothetical protein